MDRLSCNEVEELLPMFFAGSLSEPLREALKTHLEGCATCTQLFKQEHPLFRVAQDNDPVHSPLAFHLDVDLLRQFVWDAAAIEKHLFAEIERHLDQCELCRQAMDSLRALPKDANELLNPGDAPFLASIDESSLKPVPSRKISTVRTWLWNPVTAYLVAAAALIVLILHPPRTIETTKTQLIPAAIVNVEIPPVNRGSEDSLTFETPTPSAYVHFTYLIGPEPTHQYSVTIFPAGTNGVPAGRAQNSEFDSLGFAHLTALLDTGKYRFVVMDIVGRDTITIQRSIRLKLR